MPHRAFVAFSGGGAKGIVHVGALKALEDRGVQLSGVAGTSAGAIVAALAAAGFRADELINAATGETIIRQLHRIDPQLRRATDLFGPKGWPRLWWFRFLLRHPIPAAGLLVATWITPVIVAVRIAWLFPGYGWVVVLADWTLISITLWRVYRSVMGGLADVGRFREALAALLQAKMFPDQPGRPVLMKHFGRDGRPKLKIVSANISRRSLHLFSADRTPDTPVADAVAASICLPFVFKPWAIDDELHLDGGIVSNLPAWPFDEERELDPEALTIAVEIEDQSDLNKPGRYSWLRAAVRTALFGAAELNLRVAGTAERLVLPTSFDLLDFDRSAADAAREVAQVTKAAGVRLDKRLVRLPRIYSDACKVAQALVLDVLGVTPGGRGGAPRVRVAVGRLERGYLHALRLSHSVGFEDDPDEGMLVPLEGSVVGTAWTEKESRLEVYPLPSHMDLPGPGNRLRRKTRWNDVKWVMCIPIADNKQNKPRLLVQLDGNMTLNRETLAALEIVEQAVQTFFRNLWLELSELEIGDVA